MEEIPVYLFTGFMDSGKTSLILETLFENDFTEEAKDAVFVKFQQSLAKGGILFIGSTEQIINYKEIGLERKNSFFYEKM